MAFGLGTDIVEVSRIADSITRLGDAFLQRLFHPQERAYCERFKDKERHYAGRFAAKEAIAKALGKGFGKDLAFADLWILNDELGKPIVYYSSVLEEKLGKQEILVSISHCRNYATATAMIIPQTKE